MFNTKLGSTFSHLGSALASLMFVWAMIQRFCPPQLRRYLEKSFQKVSIFVYPYIQITFTEFTAASFVRCEAFSAIDNYLSSNSSMAAKRLKGHIVNENQSLLLCMDDFEEVVDEFRGVRLWWASGKDALETQTISLRPFANERRYYRLTFHKRHRNLMVGPYLSHVLKVGKEIDVRNRQRKLHTNNGSYWSHVVYKHPATFQTLAMEAEKKKDIMEDLITFSQAEEFYARIGRAWKRGYLLYGPPGTGKSTMIAAMANLLKYDIYDLELTAVKDNTELRRLLIETSNRSIIVIEDIDCSLDLTGERERKKEKEGEGDGNVPKQQTTGQDRDSKSSRVTLSGLLNFIDGIWSVCGGERLIVFTTNHVENLDPALIRKGRMDKHIELSYCSFEGFKVLAKNYLQLESHKMFARIGELLEEIKITPSDVSEHLMPKTIPMSADVCLESLVRALEMAEAEARLNAKEEAKENRPSANEKHCEGEARERDSQKSSGVKGNQ